MSLKRRRDRSPHRRSAQRGFTLVELMISLLLFSLAIAGALSIAGTMVQGYGEQRQAIAAETAVRVPMDFLTDVLRQASPGVASGQIWDTATCTASALTVTNSNSGPDKLDVIYASGGAFTSTKGAYANATTTLDVNNAAGLSAGDQVVITNTSTGHLVKITAISGNTLTLASPCSGTAGFNYDVGSLVVRARHATFFIDTLDGIPTLMMDPDSDLPGGSAAAEPLAEGVEDLQIAQGIDANADQVITEVGVAAGDDEWIFNNSGEAAPPVTAIPRAVRLTLVARTAKPLVGGVTPFQRPALEDRPAGPADAFKRRVLSARIELRNTTGSP
jgi:prepilin-type N-terminal cleavage/methylation domain-containing protein